MERLSRSSTKSRPPWPDSTVESTSSACRHGSSRRAPRKPSTRWDWARASTRFSWRGASRAGSTGTFGGGAAFAREAPKYSRARASTSSTFTSPTTQSVSWDGSMCAACHARSFSGVSVSTEDCSPSDGMR